MIVVWVLIQLNHSNDLFQLEFKI